MIADIPEFAAQIDVDRFRLNGVSADQGALDQLIRILFHDLAIFEGAGLALIGVDGDEFDRLVLRDETPLDTGGKASAATTAQTRSLYHINDFRRFHRHGFFQAGETVMLLVDIQLTEILDFASTQKNVHNRLDFLSFA